MEDFIRDAVAAGASTFAALQLYDKFKKDKFIKSLGMSKKNKFTNNKYVKNISKDSKYRTIDDIIDFRTTDFD